MEPFPNPCPVCGAEDDHAARMTGTLQAIQSGFYVATVCPHPEQAGHGSGCCCAGAPTPLAGEPDSLERRVARLEEAVARLSRGGMDADLVRRALPEIQRALFRRAAANQSSGTAARTRTGIPGATR